VVNTGVLGLGQTLTSSQEDDNTREQEDANRSGAGEAQGRAQQCRLASAYSDTGLGSQPTPARLKIEGDEVAVQDLCT
jgi:hypothetical protein